MITVKPVIKIRDTVPQNFGKDLCIYSKVSKREPLRKHEGNIIGIVKNEATFVFPFMVSIAENEVTRVSLLWSCYKVFTEIFNET